MRLRLAHAVLTVLAAALVVLASGCQTGGANSVGNVRATAIPTVGVSQPPASQQQLSGGVLSSSQLQLVYRLILERFVDRVDHTALIHTAASSLRATLLSGGALPLETAPVDLVAPGSASPEADWAAFAMSYDTLVQKYPDWAMQVRLDHRVLERLMESLADQHTVFIKPEEARRLKETGYSGIGVRLAQPVEGQAPHIAEIFPETPAAQRGLRAGDRILAVEGQPISGEPLSRVVDLIRGPEGSTVSLEVERPGSPGALKLTLTRQAVDIPLVDGSVYGPVGYLRILAFSEPASQAAAVLMQEMKRRGARGWVLDLRGNSGGQLSAVRTVAGLFVDKQPIGIEVDRARQRATLVAEGPLLAPDGPLVVLIDGDSTSGAEILAAALRQQRRATLVGERTAGNVAVAEEFALPDGSMIRLTVRRFLDPAGGQLDRVGVEPDVRVALSEADLAAGRDPQLAQALERLQGQLQ